MPKAKRIILTLALLVCVVAFGGCAGRGSLSDEIDDATGAYVYKADDAGKGSAVASLGGGIDIKDGQVLVISSELEKGSLQVRLLDDDGEVVLEEEESGHASSTHELEPGSYSIGVTCNEDGTTGTMTVGPMNEDEVGK